MRFIVNVLVMLLAIGVINGLAWLFARYMGTPERDALLFVTVGVVAALLSDYWLAAWRNEP